MNTTSPNAVTRRRFITASATASAWLAFSQSGLPQTFASKRSEQINVAIVGCGSQGRVLINACLKIPQVRFRTVCDIWPYARFSVSRYLSKFGHETTVYDDYRVMLEKEKDIGAVIVATPDWMHAPITCAALEAGKHVYCETMMANTIEGARQMVLTQRRTGKLLQIGHQRRSNPLYSFIKQKLLDEARLLGQITHASAQWHSAKWNDRTSAKQYVLDDATLRQYGYDNMQQLLNWRWYKKYSSGPACSAAAHQIDTFNWFFGVTPALLIASGGVDVFKPREWYDNVIAIYEYDRPDGKARVAYDVLTTTSLFDYFERLMGIEGWLTISENPEWYEVYRERAATSELWHDKRYIDEIIHITPSGERGPIEYKIHVTLDKPVHQPHLENFFDAIHAGVPLNCPAEVAYRTTVSVLRINEAVAAQERLTFKPEDFVV